MFDFCVSLCTCVSVLGFCVSLSNFGLCDSMCYGCVSVLVFLWCIVCVSHFTVTFVVYCLFVCPRSGNIILPREFPMFVHKEML